MIPIVLCMVVALAVAGGVLYVTKTQEDEARAGERRDGLRGPRDEPAEGSR